MRSPLFTAHRDLACSHVLRGGVWFLLLAVCAGCGSSKATLAGRVTFEGQAVAIGNVVAMGVDKVPAMAIIQPDGSYELKDLTVGRVQLAVNSPDPQAAAEGDVKLNTPVAWRKLPQKYGNVQSSGLVFELKSGLNRFDLTLDP